MTGQASTDSSTSHGARSGLNDFGIHLPAAGDRAIEVSYDVLDSAPMAMALVDPGGRFHWANSALCEVVGRSREELLAGSVDLLMHPGDLVTEQPTLAELLRGERRHSDHEVRCVRPDGSSRWLSVALNVATDPSGEPLRLGDDRRPAVIVQAIDITDRRLVERELAELRVALEQRNAALERSNRDLDEVAVVLSHDLAEPLRVISGHVQLLADRYGGQLDERADEWVGYAVEGCSRMRALIDAVLAYSRVGRATDPAALADPEQTLGEVLCDLSQLIEEVGAVVQIEGPLPEVRLHPSQLAQVFTNLIVNALRYRREGVAPLVLVRATASEGGHRFEVEDNGIGVPPQHRERIFQPFQRLARSADRPGTGIGLAVCRKVIERAGGRIGVTDPPTQGALFWFTISGSEP